MISTAVELLEASKRSMFNPTTIIMLKAIVEEKDNLDEKQFIKALYDYSSHLIAYTSAEMMEVLMSPEEMSDLNATINELDEMEGLANGK